LFIRSRSRCLILLRRLSVWCFRFGLLLMIFPVYIVQSRAEMSTVRTVFSPPPLTSCLGSEVLREELKPGKGTAFFPLLLCTQVFLCSPVAYFSSKHCHKRQPIPLSDCVSGEASSSMRVSDQLMIACRLLLRPSFFKLLREVTPLPPPPSYFNFDSGFFTASAFAVLFSCSFSQQ